MPFGLAMHRPEPVDPERFRETLAKLEKLGVTWLTMVLPGNTRAEFLDRVRRFGQDVLAPLRRTS